ncbi:protein misato homolog 1 [Oryzias melastigma]|uniref:Protein misato homolog 1 n=1 Tax=Oryzias melastigma TaxID=30732 RepID=A0A3B3BGA5_ORYME|nr:protein misato homolog 1 [Oryzias melastigma]
MSSLCREVITLQLGHFSNFVGTHWWNLQDASLSYDPESPPAEIQSDVVFREGQTPGGHVTYTPRLIAMDLKGSLQTLRQEGCLYDSGEHASALTWEGSLVTHKESPTEKNPFLKDLDKLDKGEILADFPSPPREPVKKRGGVDTVNSQLNQIQRSYRLEGSIRVWSDFLRIHLHPRTITVIHQYNHDGEAHRLEAFGQGESALQGALLEELEDRLHFFVEECDYLQGFQVLCDVADGFAGLGSKVTELLQDSYGGRGILSWGLVPNTPIHTTPVKDLYRLLNCTLGMLHMATNSSLFCPLGLRGGLARFPAPPPEFPHLSFDPSLWFHSSAVLALALDAITVPYRLRNNSAPMWQVADSLAVSGRKVVSAYGAVPFPMMHGSSLPDALIACAEGLPWKPLSTCPEGGRCYGQWVTLRGFEGQKLVSGLPVGAPPPTPLHSLHSGEDVLASYLTSFYPSAPLALQLVSSPCKLTPPFPQIFSSSLDARGFLQSVQPPDAPPPTVNSAPILTSLQSGSTLDPWLSDFHRAAKGVDVRRMAPSFFSQGPEMADYEEALEQLHLLARRYRDDSGGRTQSSSEDEDD